MCNCGFGGNNRVVDLWHMWRRSHECNCGFVKNGRVVVSVLVNGGAKFEAIEVFSLSGFVVLARCRCWSSVVRASSREVPVVSLIESHLRHFYNPRDGSCYDFPRNSAADGVSMASSSFSFLACLYFRLLFMA